MNLLVVTLARFHSMIDENFKMSRRSLTKLWSKHKKDILSFHQSSDAVVVEARTKSKEKQ